ncbi:hypothetical protein QUC26_09395 [Pseudomonas asiatica]|uniref:hypothetical protein n=1 Tax=Pseudomonas asiatica TaxID=2219225 RepID=UPI0025A3086D|nr:hypothetical protein [Pseudomonas asiatica]WJM55342.1 hypothetical protein QUC26_09395 [Pseudomonas asiatica]
MQVTFKGIMWGGVVTIATTVLGKIVEGVFDVSLISPAFQALWGWIKAVWSWLGSDVSMPVWAILTLSLMSVLALVIIGLLVWENWFGKVEEGPKAPSLSDDQLTAFLAISKAIQEGQMLSGDEVRRKTGLSRIATDAALDRLYALGLIEPQQGAYYKQYASLTHHGRAFYLHLEKLPN